MAPPKSIKGSPHRRPPEPAADHAPVDEWCTRQMPGLQPVLRQLDATIRDVVPGLEFAVKYQRPFYGLPSLGWVIELAAYAVSANVVFLGGADFEQPPPLGTVGRSRYLKVTTLEQAKSLELRGYVEQAGRTPGWR